MLGGANVRREAFTAIELAVVLVLITIVALMLLPALEEGRVKAMETKCLARVRQIGMACAMYQTAHDGEWPWAHRSVRADHPEWPDPTGSLAVLYPTFAPKAYLFQCPSTDDTVLINPLTKDFQSCDSFYVSPRGKPMRPEAVGQAMPRPPSYFYDAGRDGMPGIPRNAATNRVVYGDECTHGIWKGGPTLRWLGENNHEGGGNFLFVDKHVEWLAQAWDGRPWRLGESTPYVPNPHVIRRNLGGEVPKSPLLDKNVFWDDSDGKDRYHDADLSGMMWVGDSWVEF